MGVTSRIGVKAVVPARPAIPMSAWFGLVLLSLSSILNYVDRQILSILSQSIKADLKIDDAQLGFLLGTAFVMFYAIVGIAMGRIADQVSRRKLMAAGLGMWSLMTALGGAVGSFAGLAAVRMGVGVGEATCGPCTHSLTADLFPAEHRSKAMSFIVSGTFIGAAVAMIFGGFLLERWPELCRTVPFQEACGVKPWKAVLVIAGLPGLIIAPLLLLIREPARPGMTSSVRDILFEFASTLPPLTFFSVYRIGRTTALRRNLVFCALFALAALGLWRLTGDVAQWAAAGVGACSIFTWGQMQSLRDRPLFALTFGCRTFATAMTASALLACIGGTLNTWAAPYLMRTFAVGAGSVGLSLGLIQCLSSVVGVFLGGWLCDRWKVRDKGAPMWIAVITLLCVIPLLIAMMLAINFWSFLIFYVCFGVAHSLYPAPFAAMVQDLVLPRMRGAAASAFALMSIVISTGGGPYLAGKVSALTGSLQMGLLSILVLAPATLVLLVMAGRRLRAATPASRETLAFAAGEPPGAWRIVRSQLSRKDRE